MQIREPGSSRCGKGKTNEGPVQQQGGLAPHFFVVVVEELHKQQVVKLTCNRVGFSNKDIISNCGETGAFVFVLSARDQVLIVPALLFAT